MAPKQAQETARTLAVTVTPLVPDRPVVVVVVGPGLVGPILGTPSLVPPLLSPIVTTPLAA
eukprot:15472220-Alexandrium_andersonii.AAC.1